MTAYEMRISDWSSDVCSSDLLGLGRRRAPARVADARLPPLGRESAAAAPAADARNAAVDDAHPARRRGRGRGTDQPRGLDRACRRAARRGPAPGALLFRSAQPAPPRII